MESKLLLLMNKTMYPAESEMLGELGTIFEQLGFVTETLQEDSDTFMDELKKYIEEFDFSIVSDVSPITLIEDFSSSVWYKYHFGGGLKRRPKYEKPPEKLEPDEKKLPYVRQLLQVYSKEGQQEYKTQDELKQEQGFYKHFLRQREGYFSAQSLKRFVRDELVDEESYEELKDQEEGHFSSHLFILDDENEFGGKTIIYSFYVPYNQVIPVPPMAQGFLQC